MERDVTRRHSKTMNIRKTLPAAAGFFIAAAAFAAQRNLPTPGPSEYVDTESEANVAVTNWPGLGRHVKLTLSANFTPSNCVQVALGQDTNADGDLAPEETHLVLGVDCGEPFIWNEVKVRGEGEQRWFASVLPASGEAVSSPLVSEAQESTLDCSPSPSTFTFAFKQPSAVSSRMNFAKVTTRGRGNSAAEIAAEITRPGSALFIR